MASSIDGTAAVCVYSRMVVGWARQTIDSSVHVETPRLNISCQKCNDDLPATTVRPTWWNLRVLYITAFRRLRPSTVLQILTQRVADTSWQISIYCRRPWKREIDRATTKRRQTDKQ